ncbi:N-acylneuraminate cytidylyltransferase [Streptomyces sp. DSM 41972]|uniref:N-acylneuraminate cytidylyltransferase n=1 Tax=Streptomyces althioticus subsp. attaecolombicae TaxID=3075534 RepID=A0ABU3HZ64_9ACTN|nr:N-acylneuraminate cytidylyltransferase [Streptomyces sp. DSM 41972]
MSDSTPAVRRVLAVIPARGGSKGVPAKNLAPVGGVPLVARAVRECRAARHVTDVVVSTDDAAIAETARQAGAEVVLRPADLAGDTATSEAAVLHALDAHEALHGARVDVVLLVQCTSPFLTREDVDGVAAAVVDGDADTAVTVAPFHGFVWRETAAGTAGATASGQAGPAGTGTAAAETAVVTAGSVAGPADTASGPAAIAVGTAGSAAGTAGGGAGAAGRAAGPAETAVVTAGSVAGPAGTASRPAGSAAATGARTTGEGAATARGGHGVNHDKAFRPRRQDRPQDFLETGAAYAMDVAGLREHGHRFFGRTGLVRTDPARVLEVDDPHDLARARALAPLLDAGRTGLPTADDIDAVVLDFDGTQTDDRVLIDADGREFVSVHRGDGLGVAALRRGGLKLLILSTEQNPVVAARARKLKIPVLHGVDRKDLALKQWCEEQGIAPERVLYVGNDVNDLPCFALVGWPVAVASAHDAVRGAARAVTTVPGGAGAVREIAGWILGPSLDSLPQ